MPRKKSQEEVVSAFIKKHGDRYDYSRVRYLGSTKKVEVICAKHGVFEINPSHHMNGTGCRDCYFDSKKTTKSEFVIRSRKRFGYRYDYSLFDELPKAGERVLIRCTEHDEVFLQEPRNHMGGHDGCSKCKSIKQMYSKGNGVAPKSLEEAKSEFVRKANEKHGHAYIYDQFEYDGASVNGKIICPVHGEFWQTPSNHVRKTGCPLCSIENRKQGTFKQKCQARGINYWMALKRREAGMPEDKIFKEGYVRQDRAISEITVFNVNYPNLEAAVRSLKPAANSTTIARWLNKGMTPEEAFERIPNPGYASGIIYLVRHRDSGKQYIGLTIQTLERRWEYHLQQARAGHIKGAESLHAAIREFGVDAFEVTQIDTGTTKKDLERKEREMIRHYNTLAPHGFNISAGGVSGGSNRKPTTVDDISFTSVALAVEYIAKTRNISHHAAKARLLKGRVNVKSPAKHGESLVRTAAYRAWSQIVHCATNPKSKDYIDGLDVLPAWREFEDFLKDNGQPPEAGMSFARINKSVGYFPGNCCWMSKSEASKINVEYMKEKGTLRGRKRRGGIC